MDFFPTPSNSLTPLHVLQFNSIQKLPTWKQRQIPQVTGSASQDCPPLRPLQLPVHGPGLFLSQSWVCSPTGSKANLLTPSCGEGKCSICCNMPDKESRTGRAQKARTPHGFQQSNLTGQVKGGEGGGSQSMRPARTQFSGRLTVT